MTDTTGAAIQVGSSSLKTITDHMRGKCGDSEAKALRIAAEAATATRAALLGGAAGPALTISSGAVLEIFHEFR